MGAQPPLHCPYSPKWNFFSKIEKGGKNKNSKRDRAKGQSQRRASDGVVLGRSLDQRRRQTNPGWHSLRMKIAKVKKTGRDRCHQDKEEPGEMFPVSDPHGSKSQFPKPKSQGKAKSQAAKFKNLQRPAEVTLEPFGHLNLGFFWEWEPRICGFPR